MNRLVSVVVPAYNNADYIAETVDSILGQTYENLEVVVADHSSTDDTPRILDRFDDKRLRVVRTPAGGGAPRNWNRVSREASGDYIKLVCGDDTLAPTAVAAQAEALEQHPSAVLVAAQRDLIDARGKVFVRARGLGSLDGVVPGPAAVRATVRSGTNIFGEPASVMLRRSALERAGWWDATKAYYIDAGTYAAVLEHGDLVALRRPLATFRVSASQWSVRLIREQQEQAAEFHAEASRRFPDAITEKDVRRGNAMARAVAWQRRLAYLALGSRMKPAA